MLKLNPATPGITNTQFMGAIAGQAWITGLYQMGIVPSDPYPEGFTLPDIWMSIV